MVPSQDPGPRPEGPFGQSPRRFEVWKRRSDAPTRDDAVLNQIQVSDLDAAFADYLDKARYTDRQSPWTVKNHIVAYRNFRTFLVDGRTEETPLGRALLDVDGWLRWMATRARPLAPHTVHTWWRNIRRFFAYLDTTYGLPTPFAGRKAPALGDRIPQGEDPRRVLPHPRGRAPL